MLAACEGAPLYILEPIDAAVVDAQTQQPVEGAVVVAHWQLVRGSFDGPRDAGQLAVRETVTDRTGRFHIDGFRELNPTLAELRDQDPLVYVFKPGYELAQYANDYPEAGRKTPGIRRSAAVNGRRLALEKAHPLLLGAQPVHHPFVRTRLARVITECRWKRIPLLLAALQVEAARLQQAGGRSGIPSIADLDFEQQQAGCGKVSTILEEVRK